jgi:hypothetical protein
MLDDPWLSGKIAATHALSDVHATGAEPQAAILICDSRGRLRGGRRPVTRMPRDPDIAPVPPRQVPSRTGDPSALQTDHPSIDGLRSWGAARPLIVGLFLSTFLVLGVAYTRLAPWPGPFDELQHVSYAAALQERGSLVPRFETQRVLELSDLARWTGARNYVGHPSPYYALVALLLDRSLPPAQALAAPRLLSLLLVAAAVGLTLAAGMRHFGSAPAAMTTFCALVALCPVLFPISAQVTNDSLAVLAGALAYWGAGQGPSRVGAWALAVGLVLAMWAKPNAGLLVGAWAGCFSLLQGSARTRLLVAAAGAIGAVPYLDMLWRYGTVIPATFERVSGMPGNALSAPEYLRQFLDQFLRTWSIQETGQPVVLLAFGAVLGCAGWGALLGREGPDRLRGRMAAAAAMAFVAVLVIHLPYGAIALGGSRGAASFRYYLPLWPMLAHAVALAAAEAPSRSQRMAVAGLALAAVIGGILS